MAAIEERAKLHFAHGWEGSVIDAYIEGATEQEKIDDEENGKALLYAVHKTTERTKKEMIEKAFEWLKRELADPMPDELYQQWCDEKLTDFRKAMEE